MLWNNQMDGIMEVDQVTQSASPPVSGKKRNSFVSAFLDLLILGLLLIAAAFGGYFWGVHQQLAPIKKVGPGTPGAVIPPPISASSASKPAPAASTEAAEPVAHAKKKYWLSSSGQEYIGSSITVKVNDDPIDNFFGPGKNVDITSHVKHGTNTVECEVKNLGDDYNKHKGDSNAKLILRVVAGPSVTDAYKPDDVLVSYTRNAAQTDDNTASLTFDGD